MRRMGPEDFARARREAETVTSAPVQPSPERPYAHLTDAELLALQIQFRERRLQLRERRAQLQRRFDDPRRFWRHRATSPGQQTPTREQ